MKVEPQGDGVRLELDGEDLRLLRRALERALFIDTPMDEQPAILSFCTRALESLPPLPARPR